jgi:hypothetical protein
MYMTASGVRSRAIAARGLNLWKGDTLGWRWRAEQAIRADVAAVIVAALQHASASRATFEVISTSGVARGDWTEWLSQLRPDP